MHSLAAVKKVQRLCFISLSENFFFFFKRIMCVKVSISPVYILDPRGKAKTVHGIIFFWRYTTQSCIVRKSSTWGKKTKVWQPSPPSPKKRTAMLFKGLGWIMRGGGCGGHQNRSYLLPFSLAAGISHALLSPYRMAGLVPYELKVSATWSVVVLNQVICQMPNSRRLCRRLLVYKVILVSLQFHFPSLQLLVQPHAAWSAYLGLLWAWLNNFYHHRQNRHHSLWGFPHCD